MVVIEGPDGAGKTTLMKHLAERFVLDVGKRGVANRDELYKVTRQDTYRALGMAVTGGAPQIWDRLFVSEFVYADIVGRPCEFSSTERDFVVRVMNALRFPMIVCLPPYEVVRENAGAAHQMKGVKEGLGNIYLEYREGALPWPDNVVHYDYTGRTDGYATLEEVEEEIEGYLGDRKARESWH